MLKIIAGVFLLCSFASCQKDYQPDDITTTTTDTTNNNTSKIKTYTEDITVAGQHSVTTYDANYDNSNRLISLVSESNAGNKFVYTYTSSGLNTLDIYNSGTLSIHNQFYFNSSSFIDSAFQYNNTNDTTTDKYTYNSQNQLIQDITYFIESGVQTVGDEADYTWDSNGNVIKVTDDEGTTTYDYYTDKMNSITILTSFSVSSKNLVKTAAFNDGSGNILTFQHTYTFDSQNRVLSDTASDGVGDVTIKSYTYF